MEFGAGGGVSRTRMGTFMHASGITREKSELLRIRTCLGTIKGGSFISMYNIFRGLWKVQGRTRLQSAWSKAFVSVWWTRC